MRRKAVRAFAVYRGRMTKPIGIYLKRRDAASFARWWTEGRVDVFEIRPARKAKAPKPKRWSLVDSKTFREGSWADPEPQEKKAKEKRRSRAGGSR